MWLLIAFIAVPLIEIGLFIKVGGLIGLWPTLAIVLLTAIVGSWLVRMQGAGAGRAARSSLNELRDPTEPMAHGAMILLAGALLLTPGFFTDTMGILLLIPPVRPRCCAIWPRASRVERFTVGGRPPAPGAASARRHRRRVPRGRPGRNPAARGPSGWTRH